MYGRLKISSLISLLTLCCLACTFCSAQISETKTPTEDDVLKTTVCEVVSQPSSFDGKLIELRGSVLAGLETNVLYDKNCESKKLVTIIFVEASDVQRTEERAKFWNLVSAYRKPAGKRHSITPDKYTVTATVVCRFDAASPAHPEIPHNGRLILQSVRDVVADSFDGSFFPEGRRQGH